MADSAHLVFMATCPMCNGARSQAAYGYRALIQLIDYKLPIEGYCNICGQRWAINAQDRARLAKDLDIFR